MSFFRGSAGVIVAARKLLVVLVIGCAFVTTLSRVRAADVPAPSQVAELRILWIGNYLPAMGGVPRYTKALIEASDANCKVLTHFVMDVHGSVQDLWEHKKGIDLIKGQAKIEPVSPKKDKHGKNKRLVAFAKMKPDWVIVQAKLPMRGRGGKLDEKTKALQTALFGYRDVCKEAGVPMLVLECGMTLMSRITDGAKQGKSVADLLADKRLVEPSKAVMGQAKEFDVQAIPAGLAYHAFVSTNESMLLQRKKDNHYSQEVGYFVSCLVSARLGHTRPEAMPDATKLFASYNTKQSEKLAKYEASGKKPRHPIILAAFKPGEQEAIHQFAWDFMQQHVGQAEPAQPAQPAK